MNISRFVSHREPACPSCMHSCLCLTMVRRECIDTCIKLAGLLHQHHFSKENAILVCVWQCRLVNDLMPVLTSMIYRVSIFSLKNAPSLSTSDVEALWMHWYLYLTSWFHCISLFSLKKTPSLSMSDVEALWKHWYLYLTSWFHCISLFSLKETPLL